MKKFKLFFSVALFMSGSLFVQAQVGPPETICDENGEKRVTASTDENNEIHCWSPEWTTQCWVPCDADAPGTIAP